MTPNALYASPDNRRSAGILKPLPPHYPNRPIIRIIKTGVRVSLIGEISYQPLICGVHKFCIVFAYMVVRYTIPCCRQCHMESK